MKNNKFTKIISMILSVVLIFNSNIFVASVSAELTDMHKEEIKAGLDNATVVMDEVWAWNMVEIPVSNMTEFNDEVKEYIALLENQPEYSWIEKCDSIGMNEIDGVQYVICLYVKVKEQYVNSDGTINKEQARLDGEAEQDAMDNLKEKAENGQLAEGIAELIAKSVIVSSPAEIDIDALGMTDDEVKGYEEEIAKAVYGNEDCYWVEWISCAGDAITVYIKSEYLEYNEPLDKAGAKADYLALKERVENGELEDVLEERFDVWVNNMIDMYTSVVLRGYVEDLYQMSGMTEEEFEMVISCMRTRPKFFFFEEMRLEQYDNYDYRHYIYAFTWRGETDTGYEDWEITREKGIDNCLELQIRASELLSHLDDEKLTDIEKVVLIHDWVVREAEYDKESYESHVIPDKASYIKGIVEDGLIVCGGYADSVKYFLDYAGIENYYIHGWVETSPDPHAWNVVKLDGNWYHIDATWDDFGQMDSSEGQYGYTYFLRSDEEIAKLYHCDWSGNESACTDEGSFNDYIFRYYDILKLPEGNETVRFISDAYNYYNGYWYYVRKGSYLEGVATIMKANLDGGNESIFITLDENVISSFIYGDCMYAATAKAVYKISMSDGSKEIIFNEDGHLGAYGYIDEFVMKDSKLKLDVYKGESEDALEADTEYIALTDEEDITLNINENDVVLHKGESSKLTITTSTDKVFKAQWWSMDTNILTIDEDGVMTAKAEGEVTVMCAVNDVWTSTVVTVGQAVNYGDANGDGKINVMDAVILKKHIAGFEDLNINLNACDVNMDERINVMDAVIILKYIAGYDVTLG